MRCLLPVVFGLALVPPAFGQAVDADGAARLSQDLSRYIGTDAIANRLVTVAPEGDAYRIKLDINALVGLIPPEAKAKVDVAPLSVLAKPLADGKWDVSGDGFPSGSFEADGPEGRHSMRWAIAEGKFSGIYDSALAAFLGLEGSQAGTTMSSKDPERQMQASAGRGAFNLTGAASTGGGVDVTFNQTAADFMQTVQITDESGGPSVPVTVTSDNLQMDGNAQGYRTRALLDLLAFGVAHPDKAKLAANQAEFKETLLAALPLWTRLDSTYRFNNLKVDTPLGAFLAQSMTGGFGMDGLVQDAKITYKLGMGGMTIPADAVPAWTSPLLPTDIDLNLSSVGFNLEAAARKIIDGLDLNRDPILPDSVANAIAADFKTNPPKVLISRSTARNADTELAVEGEVTFPEAKPEANITVEIAGFDKMVEKLHEASKSEPKVAQYVPMALVAKGFGKALPDGRTQWVVEAKADGSVSVNGVRLKGPDSGSQGDAQ
ncbi:MAG TPA: hypothetical protein VNS34_29120 [Rhizobiaceae bacterium]|nr:hypothetical protein [Rhizobiaceae bacterium]